MPSQTLAYTRADADMVGPRPVFAAVAAEKEMSAHTVTAEGKVVATVPRSSQIVVEHGEIKGFMEAMTMGYRTEPSSLLEGLKFGDKIRFTIDVPNKAIVKIEKLK
jgi:Cu/Ag efflux protein CusF